MSQQITLDVNEHLILFAKAFIVKDKIERWTDLLSRRPKKLFAKSSDLYKHLNMDYIVQNDSLQNFVGEDTLGVYYDFLYEPSVITFKEAVSLGSFHDAIFSIKPGKLAIYFFHEGSNFVCKR